MKSKFKNLLLMLLLILMSSLAYAHDYHTSITDIKYNPRSQHLEVAVRVFTDDLEDALSRHSKSKVTYSSSSDAVRQQLEDYLRANLSFELTKGKPLKYNYLGSEAETDVVWMYVEVPVSSTSLPQLYVKNAVLMEVFRDQMNIVNVDYKGKVNSTLFQQGETFKKFEFKG
ncbi:DUF6702 family protein [Pontibacter silvestris]|uniref:DUF6702 family protein n=1 Tax=Pontibacter silvestris TaxID=2305183 RepID=A0ABW4WXU1_9BACT|nr:DUF6702 family protein [Pontibacter silvestris]MCC9138733.1 hypothetical protein [Pontibacter silvestris]